MLLPKYSTRVQIYVIISSLKIEHNYFDRLNLMFSTREVENIAHDADASDTVAPVCNGRVTDETDKKTIMFIKKCDNRFIDRIDRTGAKYPCSAPPLIVQCQHF